MANGFFDPQTRQMMLGLGAGLLGSGRTTGDRFRAGLLGAQQGLKSGAEMQELQRQQQERERRDQLAQQVADQYTQTVDAPVAGMQGHPARGGATQEMGLPPQMQAQGLLAAEAIRGGDPGAAGGLLGIGTGSDLPSNVREWQYYQSLPADQQEQYLSMKRGQEGIQLKELVRADGSTMMVRHDPGSGQMWDLQGQPLNDPVSGRGGAEEAPTAEPQQGAPAQPEAPQLGVSPTPAEQEAAEVRAREDVQQETGWSNAADKYRQLESKWANVGDRIDEAISETDWTTTGPLGSVGSNVPGTPQYNYYQTLQTIKANIGFDELQRMRDASPTGGALGQVSEMENRLLQAVQGSLEVGQSPSQMKTNLRKIKNRLQELREAKRRAYLKDRKQFGEPGEPAIPGPAVDAEGDDPLGLKR